MAGPVWAARVPWRPKRCCANHQARVALMPSRAEPATCLVDQLPRVQWASRSGAPWAKTGLRYPHSECRPRLHIGSEEGVTLRASIDAAWRLVSEAFSAPAATFLICGRRPALERLAHG